jgi:hypothetical protein
MPACVTVVLLHAVNEIPMSSPVVGMEALASGLQTMSLADFS